MTQNRLSVTAQDLQAVIRSQTDENVNLKMVNAALTRQYVELQAEHAKCGKAEDAPSAAASENGAKPMGKRR